MKKLFRALTSLFTQYKQPSLALLFVALTISAWQLAAHKPATPLAPPPQTEREFESDAAERADWFRFQRVYPGNDFPADARRRAWAARPPAAPTAAQMTWLPLGPAPTNSAFPSNWGNTSGRINSIAVSPGNANLVLVGSATGGIWRSTDGGTNFSAVTDTQVDLAVGAIAFAPSNNSIVYAGMGDGQGSYLGSGVLKSTDGGQTWARVSNASLPSPGLTMGIAVSPTDPNRVYLAQYAALSGSSLFSAGFYYSADGGVSWTRTLTGLARGIVVHPTTATTLYLAMSRVDQGGLSPGVYRSTDSGLTWTRVYTSPFTTTNDMRVAVTPANPQAVFVYTGGTTGTFSTRVEVSTNEGASFTNLGATGVDTGQFGYNTYIQVSPSDANTIYLGTRDVFKSTNGGASYTNLTRTFDGSGNYTPNNSNAHPDQHGLTFAPGNANTLFISNDGGVYKSTDGGTNFASLNNTLALSQFIGVSINPNDATRSYGGTQDNGNQKRLTTGQPAAWREFFGGDGGRLVINPLNPTQIFPSYVQGTIFRFENNGDTFGATIATSTTFGEAASGPRIAFYPPITGNRVNAQLYFGSWRMFTSTNLGVSWSAPAGTFDMTKGVTANGSDVLSALAVARSNTQVIYSGSRQGRAMVSSDGGANWTDVTGTLPNRSITSITVSPTNPAQAYLTMSGYGTGHVFATTNTGGTWTDISGNLPDIPTNALLIDPLTANTLYAGTDIGVFRSTTNGTTWNSFNNGMPPVVVMGFDTHSSGIIQAATYGRGIYEMNVALNCSYTLAPTSQSFSATSGSGSFNVNTTAGCGWTATTAANWISFTSNTGNGSGAVNFNVQANPNATPRSATIDVQGQTFTVNQAANCTFSFTPLQGTAPAAASSSSVAVTVGAGCAWTATSQAAWLSITGAGTGNGNGTVNYNVAANTGGPRSGTLLIGGAFFTINQAGVNGGLRAKKADFDGDFKTDLSVWTPSTGNWSVLNTGNNQIQNLQWGAGFAPFNDVIVPGDYDGDGKADHAIWRGADSIWYIRKSSDGQPILQLWGTSNAPYFDIPTPGDFDGDGKTDLAVWRRDGTWFVKRSSDGGFTIVTHGQNGDTPIPADYDGDGKTDFAVFRPNAIAPVPNWFILQSSTNTVVSFQWGAGYAPYFDTPVPADYDADGKADLAIWRGADSIWYIRPSATPNNPQLQLWGTSNAPYFDIPAPADYDGDGKADIAVFRRTGTWFVLRSSNGTFLIQTQGQQDDVPVPANGVR